MLKKILLVMGLLLLFTDGAFACCALCNVSGWELIGVFGVPLLPFIAIAFLI